MSLKVSGNIKLDVQGTGSDRAQESLTRDFQITDVSSPYRLGMRRPVNSTSDITIVLSPIATASLVHIKASIPIKIIYNNGGAGLKTCTTAHFFVQKAGITQLRLRKNTTNAMADILVVGK